MPRRVASWWRAAEEKRRARSHPSTPAPRRLCCTRGHPRGRGSGRAPCRPSPRRPRGERGAVLGSWSRGQLLSHHQHHHRTSKLWWSIAGGLRGGSASDRGKEADLDPGPATEDPPSPSSTLSRSARSPSLAPRGVSTRRLLASHASKEVWETFPEILCPKNPGFDHRFRPQGNYLGKLETTVVCLSFRTLGGSKVGVAYQVRKAGPEASRRRGGGHGMADGGPREV